MIPSPSRKALALCAMAACLLAVLIWQWPKPSGHAVTEAGHEKEHAHETDAGEQIARGPHGGRLLEDRDMRLELSIAEQGGSPEFRVYLSRDAKPVAAAALSAELQRLGRSAERIEFVRENDYFKSTAVIGEPHSFKVSLAVVEGGKQYRFAFEQVEARVMMPGAQLARSGVDVHTAGPATIRSSLALIGEVRANDERQVHVVPRAAGIAEQVPVRSGDQVRKGQLLAVLSSAALADLRAEVLAAKRRLDLATASHERERSLWEGKISAEQDYQQALAAMQEAGITYRAARDKLASFGAGAGSSSGMTRYELRAPIAGTIAMRHVTQGESVREDTPIFTIIDLSDVWVEATIPVKDLPQIRRGQKVAVRGTSFDASGTGTVASVDAVVGEETRSARARIVVSNKEGLWRPGVPVQVELLAAEETVAVAVDNAALQELNGRTVVFGRYGDAFEARPVRTGRRDSQYTEVLEGLNAGERYAARNSFLIKADLGKASVEHEH
jgi:cobalt-zinc-cadmium efflux system membrane fusion protein